MCYKPACKINTSASFAVGCDKEVFMWASSETYCKSVSLVRGRKEELNKKVVVR